ncbi:N-formylglutamate amidohydrolase, partial [Escherichia coli]|uniref:N-formylglutamate amidohydrolase n=1 Tax=Escherichia coli TaxID=562 RepID=UPI00138688E9
LRADIVVSDSKGKSCDPRFKDLVIAAYASAGFKVGYNWPYFGGRVTEQYGDPKREQHAQPWLSLGDHDLQTSADERANVTGCAQRTGEAGL